MAGFLDLFKNNRYAYVVVFSITITILLINETIGFAERIYTNKMLLAVSLLVFFFLFNMAIKNKIWVRA